MIKPIKTKDDLTQAKKRLSGLFNSNQTGVHDDEIAVLSTLVEQFEKTHIHIDAPSPTAAIKFPHGRNGADGSSARTIHRIKSTRFGNPVRKTTTVD
jgi:HTH-type transcriptional regulator/antitoxin HigA